MSCVGHRCTQLDGGTGTGGGNATGGGGNATGGGGNATGGGGNATGGGGGVTEDGGVTVDGGATEDGGATNDGGPPGPCTQTLVIGEDKTAAPSVPRPALGTVVTDPTYGSKFARVTDSSQVTDRDFPTWVRHEYSRRQAFNTDSTRVVMISSNGWLRLYDVNANGTLTFVKTLSAGEPQEPNWHPTDPNKLWLFGFRGAGMKITTYDVTTDQTSTYRDLGARLVSLFPGATRAWTKQEGRPSDDGRVFCLMVENANFGTLGLVAYDAVADRILGSMVTTDRPDHISTSPKGDYCVPSWGAPKGTRAYKTDFSSYTQLHTASEHSDLAMTKAGDQVYVYADYSSEPTNGGHVVMTDLATGAKANLFALYGPNHSSTAMHISGTSRNRPGYVTIGLYACTENYRALPCDPAAQWFKDRLVAVELTSNPRIFNLAHTHYGNAGYFSETQSMASPDLTRVLFGSTWESSAAADVASYLLQVPACALP